MTYSLASSRTIVSTLAITSLLVAGSACGGGTGSEDAGGGGGRDTGSIDAPIAPGTDAPIASGTDVYVPPGTDANLPSTDDAHVDPSTDAYVAPGTDAAISPDAYLPPGGCVSNDTCTDTEWCSAASCGAVGRCDTRPRGCPRIYDPVCGCDGMTYGNECEANAAGQNAASRGECPTTGDCRSNGDCGRGQYCAGMGCDTAGTCETMPDACIDLWAPVCGCDGNTYSNDCDAASAGMRVASVGECASTGGCGDNDDCRSTEYCAGMGCRTPGTCQPRPDICSFLYDPVCGCDGVTYSNECSASAAGVRAATRGECPTSDRCDPPCTAGQHCELCRGPSGGVYVCLPDGSTC